MRYSASTVGLLATCLWLSPLSDGRAAELESAFSRIQALLAAQDQPRQEMLDNALLNATRAGNIPEMRRLAALGADPNHRSEFAPSPLGAAASGADDPAILDALIELGARVDGRGLCDYTALHHAAGAGRLQNVKALIVHRADVGAKACLGYTPLAKAAEEGHADVAEYLLGVGADPNPPIWNGRTPLLLAMAGAIHWRARLIEALLADSRTEVNVADDSGMTALKFAVKDDSVPAVKLLLSKRGINVNDDSGGFSALFLARVSNRTEIADLLVAAGARD